MRLRGGKTRRRIAVDMGSWEYFAVPCNAGATLSIAARLIGEGRFNLYLVGSEGVIQAPVKGRLSGFDRRKALWSQEETSSVAMTYTATKPGTLYVFFDNHHDELEPKFIDADIRLHGD
jgi:hypothetical protein